MATMVSSAVHDATTTSSTFSSPSEAPSTGTTSSGSSSSGNTVTSSDGSTWAFAGCYVDQVNPVRSLGGNPEWWGQQITSSNCVDHCSKIGMSMAGTENGGQCFCGNSLVGSKQADPSECNVKCKGDSSQTCGGPARLSLYKKSSASKRDRKHRHLARHIEAVS